MNSMQQTPHVKIVHLDPPHSSSYFSKLFMGEGTDYICPQKTPDDNPENRVACYGKAVFEAPKEYWWDRLINRILNVVVLKVAVENQGDEGGETECWVRVKKTSLEKILGPGKGERNSEDLIQRLFSKVSESSTALSKQSETPDQIRKSAVGVLMQTPDSGPAERQKAFNALLDLAKKNDYQALLGLNEVFKKDKNLKKEHEKELVELFNHFHHCQLKHGENADPDALVCLGLCFENEIGTDFLKVPPLYNRKDLLTRSTVAPYKDASEQGHPYAAFKYGEILEKEYKELLKNESPDNWDIYEKEEALVKACFCYLHAAKNGIPEAQEKLKNLQDPESEILKNRSEDFFEELSSKAKEILEYINTINIEKS